MHSRIYSGALRHERLYKVRHAFDYGLHMYALDLDELDELDGACLLFGHNRVRPLALHDRDEGKGASQRPRAKLRAAGQS